LDNLGLDGMELEEAHLDEEPLEDLQVAGLRMVVDRLMAMLLVDDLEDLPVGMPVHFAIEFNLAGLPGGMDNRYYYDHTGQRQGRLDETLSQPHCERIGLIDEWLGIDVSLDFPMPCSCWAFPIETVSQSEGGFETVHQSCCVVPHWEFVVPEDGRWSVELALGIDTSAALARELCRTAEPRSV